jgi:putative ABC transport system substrate-binding protein
MRRREVLAGLASGTAAAWSPVVGAQQAAERPRRIGVLTPQSGDDTELRRWLSGFTDSLRQLGWVEGRNLHIEYRAAAGDLVRLGRQAAELVGLKSDVILAHSTPATRAMRQATDMIPIVFVNVADPLGGGFVESFAHPGGNLTGFTNFDASVGGKWVELLREIAPSIERIGMLFSPETAASGATGGVYLPAVEKAAQEHNLKLIVSPLQDPTDIDRTIAALGREPGAAMLVMPNAFTFSHRQRITSIAAEHRLPAIYPWRAFVVAGGLMAYGVDIGDQFRRAASYVDRILKGARPGDLPVQAPTKFELIINLTTAKALGLKVPQPLFVAADEVIE